jgi:hypothetical protein
MFKLIKQKVMKKIIVLFGMLALLISSCKKDSFTNPVQSRSTNEVAQHASLNAAAPYKEQYDIDLADGYLEINSCTGELIDIVTGIWHISTHAVVTSSNRVMVKFHTNTSNYKLINLTTGTEYTGSYVSDDELTFNLANVDAFPFEETTTLKILLTTPGGGNNSTLKATYHITVDANGNFTAAWFDNWRFGCQ